MSRMTMGVLIGNRGFFPDKLCGEGRRELLSVLEELDIDAVTLPESEGVAGSIETRQEALKAAGLFEDQKEAIDGVLVSLPNFGDEKAIVTALRESGLNVPVLVQAFPDEEGKMDVTNRRDSFCGKISVCNNLRQYGIPFSLTASHTVSPGAPAFRDDLLRFAGVCRVVRVLSAARVGLVGPRPSDFNTVRFSEKILEGSGISVETAGLLELTGQARDLPEATVASRRREITGYIDTGGVPDEALDKMAALLEVLSSWVAENDLDAVALQCWDAIQAHYGINPCTVMSMLSQSRIPTSCEVDVMGALSMLALQAAAEQPSALVDWNNNFRDEQEKAVIFHCGNYPADVYDTCAMKYADILATSLGEDKTYGAIRGNVSPANATFARLSTDDRAGEVRAYVAEGRVTDDVVETIGSWGVIEVPGLQELLRHICREGFEHHVAMNLSHVGDTLTEAFSTYLGWDVYRHEG